MRTPSHKAPAKQTGGKYSTVDALLRGEHVSPAVREKISEFEGESAVSLQLAQLRQSAGITQVEMAKQLGVTQGTISKLETGPDREITLHEIREYARVTEQRIGLSFGNGFRHTAAIRFQAYGAKKRLGVLKSHKPAKIAA